MIELVVRFEEQLEARNRRKNDSTGGCGLGVVSA